MSVERKPGKMVITDQDGDQLLIYMYSDQILFETVRAGKPNPENPRRVFVDRSDLHAFLTMLAETFS